MPEATNIDAKTIQQDLIDAALAEFQKDLDAYTERLEQGVAAAIDGRGEDDDEDEDDGEDVDNDAGRAERALASFKESTVGKQKRADFEQAFFAELIGGENDPANNAFDVYFPAGSKAHCIEFKTVVDNDNDKLTMHPESRERKEAEALKLGAKTHTVAVDVRGDVRTYYYKAGLGAFRLDNMEQIAPHKLKEKFV